MPELLALAPVSASPESILQPSPPLPSPRSLFHDLVATEKAYSDPLTTPISECFHWSSLLAAVPGHDDRASSSLDDYPTENSGFGLHRLLEGSTLYLVVFRSVRGARANDSLLYKADAEAHAEAKRSGGLLRYWYGTLNEKRECLAMCIWDSQESAAVANRQPKHRIAMQLASQMYETYTLERYWLTVVESPDRMLSESPAPEAVACIQLASIPKSSNRKGVGIQSEWLFEFELIKSQKG